MRESRVESSFTAEPIISRDLDTLQIKVKDLVTLAIKCRESSTLKDTRLVESTELDRALATAVDENRRHLMLNLTSFFEEVEHVEVRVSVNT